MVTLWDAGEAQLSRYNLKNNADLMFRELPSGNGLDPGDFQTERPLLLVGEQKAQGPDAGWIQMCFVGQGAAAESGDKLLDRQPVFFPYPWPGDQEVLVDWRACRQIRSQGERVAFAIALDADHEGLQRSQTRSREHSADGGETSAVGSGHVAFEGGNPIAHRKATRRSAAHDVIVDDLPLAYGFSSRTKEDSAGGSRCIDGDHRPGWLWQGMSAGMGWKSLT